MTAQWAPENERSRYVAVVTTGQYLGTALTLVCSPMVKVWWQGIFCAQNRRGPCPLLEPAACPCLCPAAFPPALIYSTAIVLPSCFLLAVVLSIVVAPFPCALVSHVLLTPALWCSADLFGGMGLCWVVLWWHQAASSPSVDRRIPPQELRYTRTIVTVHGTEYHELQHHNRSPSILR